MSTANQNTSDILPSNQPSTNMSNPGFPMASIPVPHGFVPAVSPVTPGQNPIPIPNAAGPFVVMPVRSASYTPPGVPVQRTSYMAPMPANPNMIPVTSIPIQFQPPFQKQDGVNAIPLVNNMIPQHFIPIANRPGMPNVIPIPTNAMPFAPPQAFYPQPIHFAPAPPSLVPLHPQHFSAHPTAQPNLVRDAQPHNNLNSSVDEGVHAPAMTSGEDAARHEDEKRQVAGSIPSNNILPSNVVSAINMIPSTTSSIGVISNRKQEDHVQYSPNGRSNTVKMHIGNVQLYYFDVKGLIAKNYGYLFCLITGIVHSLHRITFQSSEWKELRSHLIESGENLSGQLPILRFNDVAISESLAILRFLGRKSGRYGRDMIQDAQIDSIVYKLNNWYDEFHSFIKKTQTVEQYQTHRVKFYQFFEKMAERSNTVWLGSNAVATISDVMMFSLLWDDVLCFDRNLLAQCPKLEALFEAVLQINDVRSELEKMKADWKNSPLNFRRETKEKPVEAEKTDYETSKDIYEQDIALSAAKAETDQQIEKVDASDEQLCQAIEYSDTIYKMESAAKVDMNDDMSLAMGVNASLLVEKVDKVCADDYHLAEGIALSEIVKEETQNGVCKIEDDATAIAVVNKIDEEVMKIDEAEKLDEDVAVVNAIILSEQTEKK